MVRSCTHFVNVTEASRAETPVATHFSASDCGGYPIPQPNRHKVTGCAGARRPMHAVNAIDRSRAQAPTSSYWGPQDCGGGSGPRPSGYKSNDFCECRMMLRASSMRSAGARSIHGGFDDGCSALENCGCMLNTIDSAC